MSSIGFSCSSINNTRSGALKLRSHIKIVANNFFICKHLSLTSVTPTSVISETVLTNPSSSNERAKATISSSYMSNSGDENRKNVKYKQSKKMNRTTIFPEQQDYLIVAHIWFQNTRARERKGDIKFDPNSNLNGLLINKICLHFSLTFELKSSFENLLLSKHNDLYKRKDEIDFDLFPSSSQLNDKFPLDLSKKLIKTEISENEYFTNESNNSTDQSSNDNEHFK
ncbi:unnamed protein product [Rotaria sp. Silwood2]|nr:unnamed protein product [Rotaria sp. Silwood2]CAF4400407.1 unnamed protein product [Rotaria sp. Silwood2]